MKKIKKVKIDFFDGCPVYLDETPYNIERGINMMYGEVRHYNDTLGVLIKLENGGWVYYFADGIQAGIIG